MLPTIGFKYDFLKEQILLQIARKLIARKLIARKKRKIALKTNICCSCYLAEGNAFLLNISQFFIDYSVQKTFELQLCFGFSWVLDPEVKCVIQNRFSFSKAGQIELLFWYMTLKKFLAQILFFQRHSVQRQERWWWGLNIYINLKKEVKYWIPHFLPKWKQVEDQNDSYD